jgi:WD40 repeat protein
MSDEWSACLQTLEGHSDWVSSVAFSHVEEFYKLSTVSSSLQRLKGWPRRVTKLRLLKDVSEHDQRVASVTSMDIRGLNVDSDRLTRHKMFLYYLVL